MKLSEAWQDEQLHNIRCLYEAAFPTSEKKPFSLILEKRGKGMAEILSIEKDDGEFLGLAIMVGYRDLALLDYFAVSESQRGNGIGSTAFQMLKKRYADKRFFIEIEDTAVKAANHDERLSRKNFYLRNGMKNLPFYVNLLGVEMEILSNACTLTFEEYHELYQKTFGSSISKNVTCRTSSQKLPSDA